MCVCVAFEGYILYVALSHLSMNWILRNCEPEFPPSLKRLFQVTVTRTKTRSTSTVGSVFATTICLGNFSSLTGAFLTRTSLENPTEVGAPRGAHGAPTFPLDLKAANGW